MSGPAVGVRNAVIAELVRRYAAALRIQGENRFKVKAYERAASSIELLDRPVAEFIAGGGDLEDLPGIGKAIGGMVRQIVDTGRLPALETSLSKFSPGLVELSARPSLDPKIILRVYKKLGISSLDELSERLESGEIEQALGRRIAFQIRVGLDARPRMLWWKARPMAARILEQLRALPEVAQAEYVGSLRRRQETVADLGFLVAGRSAAAIFKKFAQLGGVQAIEKRNASTSIFKFSSGIVTLVWTKPEQWGWALIRATGSSEHLRELAAVAKKRRQRWSVTGLAAKKIDLKEEAPIYEVLGLRFIEPELREGRGEIEAARDDRLPDLVTLGDLRGDLHMHSTSSDGANTIAEMAAACQARGYRYLAITDHSQSLKIARGVSEKDLARQLRAIDNLNARLRGFTVLKSAEVDILEDGTLDYPDGLLKELDFTICSIHSLFRLNKSQQTTRLLRAMDNPYFNILGHATGRLLLRREGYEVDFAKLLRQAKDTGCMFEINSNPNRLDLSDEHARLAKEAGILMAINTDAHSIQELDFITGGINQARRAWLEPINVLNTLPLTQLKKHFRR